jgi:hypothetical protein
LAHGRQLQIIGDNTGCYDDVREDFISAKELEMSIFDQNEKDRVQRVSNGKERILFDSKEN